MKALTLIQPWVWAVCYAGKSVENRDWCPPPSLWGQDFALHAGKKYEAQMRWLSARPFVPGGMSRPNSTTPARRTIATTADEVVAKATSPLCCTRAGVVPGVTCPDCELRRDEEPRPA